MRQEVRLKLGLQVLQGAAVRNDGFERLRMASSSGDTCRPLGFTLPPRKPSGERIEQTRLQHDEAPQARRRTTPDKRGTSETNCSYQTSKKKAPGLPTRVRDAPGRRPGNLVHRLSHRRIELGTPGLYCVGYCAGLARHCVTGFTAYRRGVAPLPTCQLDAGDVLLDELFDTTHVTVLHVPRTLPVDLVLPGQSVLLVVCLGYVIGVFVLGLQLVLMLLVPLA